ncbi:MAG: CstA-like transporter-associated (seleno)protein [Vicinamibacteria bacterium]
MSARFVRAFRAAWAFVRAVFGDSAYERHAARAAARGLPALSRRTFYLAELERRYSGVNRCC